MQGTLVFARSVMTGTLMAGMLWLPTGDQTTRADDSPTAPAFLPPGAADLDSESLLIKRRAMRLAGRAVPAPPPKFEIAKAKSIPPLSEIDRFIYDSWREAGLTEAEAPPPVCDDATFCRRVYLDLIGIVPQPVEVNRFLADRSAGRRAKLIDELLARDADYADHWTPFWEDALASQPVLSQGGIPTRGDYRAWIHDSLQRNRPYDVMVAELLDPTMPGRHRAVDEDLFGTKYTIEYVRNEDHTVTLQTAANIGQVFLGTSMKCASCHDHFDNTAWTQRRFLGFAGLFAPRDLELVRCDVHLGETVPARFPFEVPGMPAAVPSDLEGRLRLAAQLVTDPLNPRFAETIVNRLWKRYLGLGLYEPADDARDDRPASHPALLDWLAYDFIEHGCDLKHTIRLILASRVYQHRYDPDLEDHFDVAELDDVQGRRPRWFRSPALRRLSAEQQIDSVRLAITGQLDREQRCYLDARSTALMRALGRPASRNEISTARSDDVAVTQALELLNGHELHAIIDETDLAIKPAARRDPRRLIDHFYLAVLGRHATAAEKKLGKELFDASETADETIRDLLWALVCSPEFQYMR